MRCPTPGLDGQIVSSSRIRQHILDGAPRKPNRLLGYPYRVSGEVIQGAQVGRTIGFPTANVEPPSVAGSPAGRDLCHAWPPLRASDHDTLGNDLHRDAPGAQHGSHARSRPTSWILLATYMVARFIPTSSGGFGRMPLSPRSMTLVEQLKRDEANRPRKCLPRYLNVIVFVSPFGASWIGPRPGSMVVLFSVVAGMSSVIPNRRFLCVQREAPAVQEASYFQTSTNSRERTYSYPRGTTN